jgi:hypothetical protein
MNDVTGAALGADAAAAAAAPAESMPAADSTASTAPRESASHESSPSLLSSAAGKGTSLHSDQPAPAADAKSEPDAKAADAADPELSSKGKKDGDQSAKPDESGKALKPEDKAAAATDPATKDATATAPPAPVSVDDLKFPDGMTIDAEAGKALVDLINNAELTGKDRSQGLVDLHLKELDRVAKHLTDHQRKVWDDLNAGWKDDVRKDPELGGNRLQTNLSMAKAVIEDNLSPEEAKELLIHGENNGMNNFRPFIRLLANIGKKFNVFEDSIVQGSPQAPSARGPGKRGWYDKSLNASGS